MRETRALENSGLRADVKVPRGDPVIVSETFSRALRLESPRAEGRSNITRWYPGSLPECENSPVTPESLVSLFPKRS